MNESEFEKLLETSWRRELSEQEQAALKTYLATDPQAHTRFAEEKALSGLLGVLPDVPVSSNFTAQVLQAVEREARHHQTRRAEIFSWLRPRWLPRVAMVCLLLVMGLFSATQYRQAQRVRIAQDVALVSNAADVPRQWLEDFDAINRLSQPPVDNELLAALQ